MELIFTAFERPKKIEAIIKYRILFFLTNFIIKRRELNKKKI